MAISSGLASRLVALQGSTNLGLHVRHVIGAQQADYEASRIPGTLVSAKLEEGVVEFLVTGNPAAFPNMNGYTIIVPFDEIVAIDKP